MKPTSTLLVLAVLALLTLASSGRPTEKTDKPAKSEPPPAKKATPAEVANPVTSDLFDGKTLKQWKVLDFAGKGKVAVVDGSLRATNGEALTGARYLGELPKYEYEVTLEARKVEGDDFFVGLTFPYGDSNASFIVGGWGGMTTGISSIDFMDASENQSSSFADYKSNQWYKFRLQVKKGHINAWIDEKQVVDLDLKDRKVSMRFGEIEDCVPLGLATYRTTADWKNIKLRRLPGWEKHGTVKAKQEK